MASKEIICDTDVIIDFLNDKHQRHNIVATALGSIGIKHILISSITEMELIAGTHNKEALQRLIKNIRSFRSININQEICQIAVDLMHEYNLSHGLAIADALIAATALGVQLPLFTYNIKDYRFIKGLQLFNH